MATIAKIDGINLLDVIRADSKVFLEIAKIDGLETGTFNFAKTSSNTFRIQSMDSTSAINIFAVNNNVITHSQSYLAGQIPDTVVVLWDLSSNVGETSIYFTGFDLSTVTELNMAFSNDLSFLNTSLMSNMTSLLLRSQPSLTSLDLTTNTSLNFLDIGFVSSSTGITDLGNVVGIENTVLTTLNADNLFLTGFGNLNSVTTLQTIRMTSTRSSNLNITNLTNLNSLIAGDNRFTSLNLSGNINLTGLSIPSSPLLNSLDLSNNTSLLSLDLLDSPLPGGVTGINLLTNLNSITLRNYQGDNITLNSSSLNNLFTRNCDNLTTFTGFNVASLLTFDISSSSSLATVNIDLSNCSNLTSINLNNTNVTNLTLPTSLNALTTINTSFCPNIHNSVIPVSNMPICNNFILNNCNFSEMQLDSIFIEINSNTTTVGTINVSNQTTGDTPSATSLAARNNLITNGWTIIL